MEKTDFNITAHESLGGDDAWQVESTQTFGGEQSKQSERDQEGLSRERPEERPGVQAAAPDGDRHERERGAEATTFHEIQNPNDELTVTYLFYELQRTFRLSERIHQLTPGDPGRKRRARAQRDRRRLAGEHDWIFRRTILDDSFRPALDYLTDSFVGAEVNIRLLRANVLVQRTSSTAVKQQLRCRRPSSGREELICWRPFATSDRASSSRAWSTSSSASSIRLASLAGRTPALWARPRECSTTRRRRATARIGEGAASVAARVAMTALQAAVDKLSAAIREHYDQVSEIDRLRVHVKDNILYYMQAIWSHEPPDQRYFRIYDIDVPVITPTNTAMTVEVAPGSTALDVLLGRETAEAKFAIPSVEVMRKKLVEVADLDTVLGYEGNYSIFPLKENNLLTLHMMQGYLESSGSGSLLRDPRRAGEYSVAEIQRARRLPARGDRTSTTTVTS